MKMLKNQIKKILKIKSVAALTCVAILMSGMSTYSSVANAATRAQCIQSHDGCKNRTVIGFGTCLAIGLLAGPLTEFAVARCTAAFVTGNAICNNNFRRCITNASDTTGRGGVTVNTPKANVKGAARNRLNNLRKRLSRGGLTNAEKRQLRTAAKRVARQSMQ